LFLKHFTFYLDAWTVNGVRYLIASIFLVPTLFMNSRQNPLQPSIWRSALVPALVNSVSQITFALIPYYVSASVMGFGIRFSFLFTIAGSLWLLPGERTLVRSRFFWPSVVLSLFGIIALFWGSLFQQSASMKGLLILLAETAAWGFYGVTVRKYMAPYPPHRSFAAIGLYTAAILISLMLVLGRFQDLFRQTPETLALLIISALLGITMTHVLMYYVLNHLGAIIESAAEIVVPFLTFLGTVLLFHDRLDSLQWLGGLGVIAGCAFMLMARRQREGAAAQAASGTH
jgi:drug/metabolite transporter (DMT)-like permease